MIKKVHHYSIEYQYDDINRLISAKFNDGSQYIYVYDQVGDMNKMIYKDQASSMTEEAESVPLNAISLDNTTQAVWFISRENQQFGPYSWNDLKNFVPQNRLFRNDLLWSEELTEWTRAEKIKGLF